MGMTERILNFTGATGLTLVATETGPATGQPVLLLHGGGQTRQAWAATALALAKRGYRAVALDMRGHGESDWAPDGYYHVDAFAADLRVVVNAIGGKPVLVGASLGGLSSMLACGEAPHAPLSALVLVDIVPWMEQRGGEQVVGFMRGTAGGFDTLEEAAEAIAGYLPHRKRPPTTAGLTKNLRRHADGRWYWHWDPQFISGPEHQGPMEIHDVDRLNAAVRSILDGGVPILLVRGQLSDLVSAESAEAFLSRFPQVEFIDVAGAGHMVAGDRNDAFADAILAFLARHSA